MTAASASVTERDDVVLMYSRHCSGSIEWAKYLHKLYTELSKHKGKLRVRHLPLEDVADSVLPVFIEEEIYQSRLQIVLISPTFLEFIFRHPSVMIGRLLNPDRVIAIMLGVKDDAMKLEHRTCLVSFSQWIHLEAKDHDLEFVQTVLYFSTQILQRTSSNKSDVKPAAVVASTSTVQRQQHLLQQQHHLAQQQQQQHQMLQQQQLQQQWRSISGGRPESNFFHIHPRKVTEGQNRVLIIFETPQSSRSQFRVTLERSQFGLSDLLLEETKYRNPYNIQVTIPTCCFPTSHLAGLRVEVDGMSRGTRTLKLESTMSEMDQLLKTIHDPVEFMCQSIGLSPACKDKLDERLTREFLSNTPKNFHLVRNTNMTDLNKHLEQVRDLSEFPTLLHFSTCHGLERLTSVLLECPGAREASNLRNGSDLNPIELAQINGHANLVKQLHAFQIGIMNSHHIYDYIFQSRAAVSPAKRVDTSTYQIPPPPRPVLARKPVQAETHPNAKPDTADPFGTLRASTVSRKKENHETTNFSSDDEVFLRDKPKQIPNSQTDKFGTLKAANRVVNRPQPSPTSAMDDYRSATLPRSLQNSGGATQYSGDDNLARDEVRLADELLKILDEFQKKSYSAKEMEEIFENWRRKSDLAPPATQEKHSKDDFDLLKEKGQKAKNLLMKVFARSHVCDSNKTTTSSSSSGVGVIATSKNVKKVEENAPKIDSEPQPIPGNETILESEISVLDECELSVFAFPPTPQKTPVTTASNLNEGISTQILPLSRLSLSGSSNCSTSPVLNQDDQPRNSFSSPPPVPDNTFTSDPGSGGSSGGCNQNNPSPNGSSGRGSKVIEKLRKSLTEPLFHYFHELQVSPDSQEPEILNTPKSVIPPSNCLNSSSSSNNNNNSSINSNNNSNNSSSNNNSSNSHLQNLRRRSRNLFNSKRDGGENVSDVIEEEEDEKEAQVPGMETARNNSVPPPIITDM